MPTLGPNKNTVPSKEETDRTERMNRRNNNREEEPTTPTKGRRGKRHKDAAPTPDKIKNMKPGDMDEEEIVFENKNEGKGDDDDSVRSNLSMGSVDSMTDHINNAEKDIRAAMEGNSTGGNNNDEEMEEEKVAAENNSNPSSSNMGNAHTPAWTPRAPSNNKGSTNKNNSNASATSNNNKNSRASFSSDTNNKTASGGKVGGSVRRQQKRTSGGQKKINHEYKSFLNIKFSVKKGAKGTLHQSIIDALGDTLTILRERDDEVAIMNASDEITPAFTKTQLPKLSVLVDEWVYFNGDTNKIFKDTIPDGKSRTYEAVIMMGSQWSPQQLLVKSVIDLQEIGVELEYKKVQELHTEKFIAILGAYNNLDTSGMKHVITLMLEEAAKMMIEDKDQHYSALLWGPESIPFFQLWRGYIKNAPYLVRGKDEKTPSWQKMAVHLEYKPEDEDMLLRRMMYAKKKGLVKKYLGKFAYPIATPKEQLPERDRPNLTRMIARHGSVNLCMGVVKVKGVVSPDEVVEIHRSPDYEGNERPPIKVSFRDVLMSIKQDGVRLFHCLNQADSGDFELVYPGGKGCDNHKITAQGWGNLPGGHLKFYLLKRGCDPMSVDNFIVKVFDTEEIYSAEGCKLLEDGTVINKTEGEMRDEIAEVEACSYVDIRDGLLKSELKEMDRGAARTRDPYILDPKSMAAFNFTKDDNTVKNFNDRADDDTIKTADHPGISLAEHTEYDMPNDDYMTTSPSEGGKDISGKQASKKPEYPWENLWDDDDDEVEYAGTNPAPAGEDNGGETTNPNVTGSNVPDGVGAAARDKLKQKEDTIAAMAKKMEEMEAAMQDMIQRMAQGSNNNPPSSASSPPPYNSGQSQPTSEEDNRNPASGSATSAQGMGQEGGPSGRSDHNPG